ncbi:hypothetical protein PTSG_04582 [Salpingoeca rosetta]|uniref:Uncharacterized protein n=1 Tax=Salpingoeca rosetta (strain ATCC 50818 / BSB-021) TaxID=946362 RepID=F2U7U9_SALR5|nr:uncharacterized protein PTSG_04582 [Salpingoeca rosetta]EGD72854.1 hypothetical protein PTSG_04582 [Salpingoeca rosetta]|eukprot:XP_004994677.1 hypothetical protein PTSG_04582 [Salpingoeca rosetta]
MDSNKSPVATASASGTIKKKPRTQDKPTKSKGRMPTPPPGLTERQLTAWFKKQNEKRTALDNVFKRNRHGETALHRAAIKNDLEFAQELLDHGAPIDAKDNAGWTPLHEACNHGHLELAELLLKANANVDAKGFEDITPLHDAAMNGHTDVVKLLVKHGADPTLENKDGQTAIDLADEEEDLRDLLISVARAKGKDFTISSPEQRSLTPENDDECVAASPSTLLTTPDKASTTTTTTQSSSPQRQMGSSGSADTSFGPPSKKAAGVTPPSSSHPQHAQEQHHHHHHQADETPTFTQAPPKDARTIHLPRRSNKASRSLEQQLGSAVDTHEQQQQQQSSHLHVLKPKVVVLAKRKQGETATTTAAAAAASSAGRTHARTRHNLRAQDEVTMHMHDDDVDDDYDIADDDDDDEEEEFDDAQSVEMVQGVFTDDEVAIGSERKDRARAPMNRDAEQPSHDEVDVSDREPSSGGTSGRSSPSQSGKRRHEPDSESSKVTIMSGLHGIKHFILRTKDLIKRSILPETGRPAAEHTRLPPRYVMSYFPVAAETFLAYNPKTSAMAAAQQELEEEVVPPGLPETKHTRHVKQVKERNRLRLTYARDLDRVRGTYERDVLAVIRAIHEFEEYGKMDWNMVPSFCWEIREEDRVIDIQATIAAVTRKHQELLDATFGHNHARAVTLYDCQCMGWPAAFVSCICQVDIRRHVLAMP